VLIQWTSYSFKTGTNSKVCRKLEVESEDSLDDNDMESAGRRLPTQARIPQILINRKSQWTSLFATKIRNDSLDPTLEGSDSSDH
jgi:hypothetical protein